MPEQILCKICGKRRARRSCPAVHGEICTICCGEEREVSLTCPLKCEYLQEAHKREKTVPVSVEEASYPDIRVTEEFLRSHEEFVVFCSFSFLSAAQNTPGAIDSDVMAALEALIQTHRTSESGLVYETRAENTIAAAIQRSFAGSLADYQKMREEREALSPVRTSEIIAALVFLHRLGQQHNNGRPRGRMFIDLLRQLTPPDAKVEERTSSIIL